MKIIYDYSPNHSKKTRLKKDIKFIIIHYTGMQSAIESLQRLKNPKSKVSCHYLINRSGSVVQMVKDKYVAWHAGKSRWKQFHNLNKCSLGIELVNKGHEFGYQNFSRKQILCLILLCKALKKKYGIKKENFLGHSDIAPLRKIDPGEKFPWKKLSGFNLGRWFKKNPKKFKFDAKKIESQFFKNLKMIGYGYISLKQSSRKKRRKIIESFQRHYLPDNVTGKIDIKTFKTSHFLLM